MSSKKSPKNNEYMRAYMARYRKTPKGIALVKKAHKDQTKKEKLKRKLPKLMKVVEDFIDKKAPDA
jgi:hypothetical protein